MFRALAEKGINIQMITTSEIKISVLVERATAADGTAGGAPGVRIGQIAADDRRPTPRRPAARHGQRRGDGDRRPAAKHGRTDHRRHLARRDAGPRDDRRLARSAGHGRRRCSTRGRGGIFVDMIVQSSAAQGTANLSFTVPQSQYDKCHEAAATNWPRSSAMRTGHRQPAGGQASVSGIGIEPHGRGDSHVPLAGRRGDQRRHDQHQRSPRERRRGRRARREGAGAHCSRPSPTRGSNPRKDVDWRVARC